MFFFCILGSGVSIDDVWNINMTINKKLKYKAYILRIAGQLIKTQSLREKTHALTQNYLKACDFFLKDILENWTVRIRKNIEWFKVYYMSLYTYAYLIIIFLVSRIGLFSKTRWYIFSSISVFTYGILSILSRFTCKWIKDKPPIAKKNLLFNNALQRVVNKKGNENDEIIDIANSTQQSVRVAPNRFKIVEKLAGRQSGLVRMKKNLSSSFVKMRPVLMIRLKNIQSDDTKHCWKNVTTYQKVSVIHAIKGTI